MKKIRFGVLGLGHRSQYLMECYSINPHIEFVAVADHSIERAQEVADKFNKNHDAQIKPYSCYEDMIKQTPLDALFIASDPDVQVDYAVDAMNNGIHVMTEVPAAYTIDQCWNLVNTVKKTGVKYQLAEQARYWNFFREWRRMAAAGEFGKIYYAEGEYLHYEASWYDSSTLPAWRRRTFQKPILYLPHELSPLLSVTGGRIEKVICLKTGLGSLNEAGEERTAIQAALMYGSNDTIFSLRAGFYAPNAMKNDTYGHWYQLKGTKANVESARSTLDTMKIYRAGGEWEIGNWGTSVPDEEEAIRNTYHGGADYYPVYYFVNAIINDTAPGVDVYQAVETAAPAIMAAESCAKGGVLLNVPDFRVF